ncbi:MAG TPA: MurR/RpiR family transcriptional regulator [Candidatus Limnocylindria bacterium]|nr:MurR/RpiR family transcriptional regulator [Candidatus Limnocylindria bacterium]
MASGTAPREDVVTELRRRYDELTQSQKRIAEAIVEDPEFIAFATVEKVATKLGVSPSTVVRFAYRMGLDGYPDLQDRVRTLVRAQMRRGAAVPGDETPAVERAGDSIFARSLAHDLDDLRRTIVGLSVPDLERAVTVLDRAERVFVFGGLGSYAVAYFAGLALDRLRGASHVLDGNDALNATRLADISERDALVVFTFAPYVRSALRLAQHAKARKASLIAVTDTPVSPVGRLVDVALPAVVSGVSTHNSLVGAMAVANALLNGLVLARSGRALERYRGVMKLLNEWDEMILRGEGES